MNYLAYTQKIAENEEFGYLCKWKLCVCFTVIHTVKNVEELYSFSTHHNRTTRGSHYLNRVDEKRNVRDTWVPSPLPKVL